MNEWEKNKFKKIFWEHINRFLELKAKNGTSFGDANNIRYF